MIHSEHLLHAIGEVNDEAIRDARFGQPVRNRSTLRRIVTVALAAVLMLAMSITAVGYFSGAEWFEKYFSRYSENELTSGQRQFITNSTLDLGQSVTQNGYTITLDSVIMDTQRAVLRFIVTAPENVDMKTSEVLFRGWGLCTAAGGVESPITIRGGGETHAVYTEQYGQPNVLTVMLDTDLQGVDTLSADTEYLVRVEGIDIFSILDRSNVTHVEGIWEFRFSVDSLTEARELLTEPLEVTVGDSTVDWIHSESAYGSEGICRVMLHSVQIAPMGIRIGFTYLDGREFSYRFVPYVRIIMKDGSDEFTTMNRGEWNSESPNVTATYHIGEPIDLTEADYLEFADGTKLYIN